MNINLTQCQLLNALKRIINDTIVIKPVIFTINEQFEQNVYTAYYGNFNPDAIVIVDNDIHSIENINNDGGISNLFTKVRDISTFKNFVGYQIKSKVSLYENLVAQIRTMFFSNNIIDISETPRLNYLEHDENSELGTSPLSYESIQEEIQIGDVLLSKSNPVPYAFTIINPLIHVDEFNDIYIVLTDENSIVTHYSKYNNVVK